jgi:hypothetical protein
MDGGIIGHAINGWLENKKAPTMVPSGILERVKGIEPSSRAWEAFVLPLNYTRGRAHFTRDLPGLTYIDSGKCDGKWDGRCLSGVMTEKGAPHHDRNMLQAIRAAE